MNNKSRIFLRVMSAKTGKSIEKDFPIDRKLDLAVGYRVLSELNEDGAMISAPLTDSELSECGLKKEELYALALENTGKLFKTRLYRLEDLVKHICTGASATDLINADRLEDDIYVLTNDSGMFGAAVMLHEPTLNRLQEQLGSAFYVLPSSVHEVLIVPERESYDPEMLRETVEGVNSTVVAETDFLSDNVYRYDSVNGIQICDVDNATSQAV